MVEDHSEQSGSTTSDGSGGICLALIVFFVFCILVLRGCFGTSQRTDPMAGITSLEVRGLENRAYTKLTVEATRLSREPFTEQDETRFRITCEMRVEDSEKLFSGVDVVMIPKSYLEGLSQHGDSFRIQPFSLRSEWARGVEFKEIKQVVCFYVVPITGSPSAVLILAMGDLKFFLDSRTSLVKISNADSVGSQISVPKTIGAILKGAQFSLTVSGDKQGAQWGQIKTLQGVPN